MREGQARDRGGGGLGGEAEQYIGAAALGTLFRCDPNQFSSKVLLKAD